MSTMTNGLLRAHCAGTFESVNKAERFKLRFGKYRTPLYRYGAVVECEVRGQMRIIRTSDGRIPWPVGRPIDKPCQTPSLVVFKGLAKAVRLEANTVVRYWWGVSPCSVWKWRRALSVPASTRGTTKLRKLHAQEPWFRQAQRKAVAKANDPMRCEKIAAAKRGRKRPAKMVALVNRKLRGKKHTAETRQKMSAAHKARGTRPPWINLAWAAWEDVLVRTLRPSEAAKETGRTLAAVNNRRHILGVPDGRRRS